MAVRRVKKGDTVKADDINVIIDEINRLGKITAGSGIGFRSTANGLQFWGTNRDDSWLGTVVTAGPSGEADYTDSRYWVSRSYVANTESDSGTHKITVTKETSGTTYYQIVTVTNLAELLTGTHSLAANTVVEVVGVPDIGSPPTTRYYMSTGLGATFPAKITAITGASFPTFSYTVQRLVGYNATLVGSARFVTDGVDIAGALNGMEFSSLTGGNTGYTYGNGIGIDYTNAGYIYGGYCSIVPLGVGAIVYGSLIPNSASGSTGSVFIFSAPNSAM